MNTTAYTITVHNSRYLDKHTAEHGWHIYGIYIHIYLCLEKSKQQSVPLLCRFIAISRGKPRVRGKTARLPPAALAQTDAAGIVHPAAFQQKLAHPFQGSPKCIPFWCGFWVEWPLPCWSSRFLYRQELTSVTGPSAGLHDSCSFPTRITPEALTKAQEGDVLDI